MRGGLTILSMDGGKTAQPAGSRRRNGDERGVLGWGGYWLGGNGKKRDKIKYGNPARARVCVCVVVRIRLE